MKRTLVGRLGMILVLLMVMTGFLGAQTTSQSIEAVSTMYADFVEFETSFML